MIIIGRKKNCTLWGDPQKDGTCFYAVTRDRENKPAEPARCPHKSKFIAWTKREPAKD